MAFINDTIVKGIFHFVKTDLGLFNSNNFLPGNPGDPNAREGAEQYLGKLEWEQKIVPSWDYRISGSIFKEHIKDKDDPELGSFDGRERSRFRPQIATAEFQTNYSWEELSTTSFGVEFKRRKATPLPSAWNSSGERLAPPALSTASMSVESIGRSVIWDITSKNSSAFLMVVLS